MRLLLCFFIAAISCSFSCTLSARELKGPKILPSLKISPTFSINIPFEISAKIDMPSLNSILFSAKEPPSRSTSQVLVVHNRPPTFANKFSVERYWNQSREQTKTYDKKENNLGCLRVSARSYRCSRDVEQDGQFHSETVFWNTKNDLVLIRVSSLTSFSEPRKLLNKIKVVQNSRLPARASTGASK